MANVEFLKLQEQNLTKKYFIPKRNIQDFRMIHNLINEYSFVDSNVAQDKYYAKIDRATIDYSKVY